MKKLFVVLAVLALVAAPSFAQFNDDDAEGTLVVNVVQNANVALSGQEVAGPIWLIQGDVVSSGWFTFEVTGDRTGTIDIALDFALPGGNVTMSAWETEGDDNSTFSSVDSSPDTDPSAWSDAPFSGSGVPGVSGSYFVRGKCDLLAVTPSTSSTLTVSVTITDYQI